MPAGEVNLRPIVVATKRQVVHPGEANSPAPSRWRNEHAPMLGGRHRRPDRAVDFLIS
jgi:hypothetical protein